MLGNHFTGCATGNVAGAHEERFEGAVLTCAVSLVEGAGGELEEGGAFAAGFRCLAGSLRILAVGFFGVGKLFGINGGRVALTHADNVGSCGLFVYVENVTGGSLDIGVGEGLRGDGCGAVGAELFFRGDFLYGYLGGGVIFIVLDGFAERTVGGDGTTGYPAAVPASSGLLLMRERTPSAIFAEEEAGGAGCSSAVSAELVLSSEDPHAYLSLRDLMLKMPIKKPFLIDVPNSEQGSRKCRVG